MSNIPSFISKEGRESLGTIMPRERHYKGKEGLYSFHGVEVLINDFYKDVEKIRWGEI